MAKRKGVLNAAKSKRNRDDALKRVSEGTSDGWAAAAYVAARKVAERCLYFTSDDVWKAGLSKPDEPRALGPIMLSLQRDGIISATSRFKSTAQPSRNYAPVRIWRSCLL